MTRRLPFQELLHGCVGKPATPFPGLLHFTLDPYFIMLDVKPGYIKYHFFRLGCDSTWDWNLVPGPCVCVCTCIYIYIYTMYHIQCLYFRFGLVNEDLRGHYAIDCDKNLRSSYHCECRKVWEMVRSSTSLTLSWWYEVVLLMAFRVRWLLISSIVPCWWSIFQEVRAFFKGLF